MNEKYKLNKEWLDLLLEHKNNANITFNLSNNDTRILLTYIEILQQENQQLKDRINKAIDLLFEEYESCEGSLSNPEHTIVSKHTLLKIEKDAIKKIIDLLKEDNKEEVDEKD
jgi:hypothetical protein